VTILYTSGSTGDPKGVLISHANMWFAAVGTGPAEISTGPDTVSYLPYAHISERLLGLYIPQTSGGHVHQVARAADVHRALVEVRPHLFFGVPRVWEKLAAQARALVASAGPEDAERIAAAFATALAWVEAQQFGHRSSPELEAAYAAVDAEWLRELRAQLGLDRVVWAGVGGAPMPLEVTRFLAGLGLVVHDVYGMTETTASISASGPDDFRLGSVGRPREGNQVRVAADGELLVKSPAVSAGYFRRAEATRDLFDDDGWLCTGDIGRVDEDGFVYITGRKKELIITSLGKNIAPSNVESLLTRHPIIGQAVVSGDGRPYLVALLSLEPSAADRYADPEAEVAAAVAAANAELSMPEQVKRYAVVPGEWSPETGELTATLKLRRKHLHTTYAELIDRLYAAE
jgi:long-chain acyl-CoA synthetase